MLFLHPGRFPAAIRDAGVDFSLMVVRSEIGPGGTSRRALGWFLPFFVSVCGSHLAGTKKARKTQLRSHVSCRSVKPPVAIKRVDRRGPGPGPTGIGWATAAASGPSRGVLIDDQTDKRKSFRAWGLPPGPNFKKRACSS